MNTLEAYLASDAQRDRSDIINLEVALSETAATIVNTFKDQTWPYEVSTLREEAPKKLSHSTTAMMIWAIDQLLMVSGEHPQQPSYSLDISREMHQALSSARKKANSALRDALGVAGGKIESFSETYGKNDPLTLSYLAEIYYPIPNRNEIIKDYIKNEINTLIQLDPYNDIEQFFRFNRRIKKKQSSPLSNAFIPLRVIRTNNTLGGDYTSNHRHLRYFESTLHDQLSFVSIPDSRFDPAELAFCLEGMLLVSRESVDPGLFLRVLAVLKTAQETSAHWRPTKPFLKSERGMVLFPISVEAANSLLRSCNILQADPRFLLLTGEVIGLLRRFWEWLAARRISLTPPTGKRLKGWHSEHVADVEAIQLWDTSQVVEFMLGYRRQLRAHIASTTLRLSRFDVKAPTEKKSTWSNVIAKFEPVATLKPEFQTYERIGREFLSEWHTTAERKRCSMLLYGPPGTGKSTIAENIAETLGFPLITITVSDFLTEGGGAVEARAKMIFEVLEAQSDCVVLFDEIDELILDRSSARHSSQDTVFKFMTPGMLTKLNNLRRKKRVIFILATNYAYRIDPAIRRTGRIDESYLLLPPDIESRKRMIRHFLQQNFSDGDDLAEKKVGDSGVYELARASIFLGYKDIEAAVGRVQTSDRTFDHLKRTLSNWPRTTSLRFYKSAFVESDDSDAVIREFLPLVQMTTQETPDTEIPFDDIFNNDEMKKKRPFASVEELKERAAKECAKSSQAGATE